MSPAFILHNTLGALFLGMVLAASLHGVSVIQTWYYYTHQNDKWPLKLLVAAVVASDTIHQGLITHAVYIYVITNWGNPEQLGKIVWSLSVEVFFNTLTAFLVQSFLTVRIWRLSNRSILMTAIAALFVVAEFVSLLVYTILGIQFETFVQLSSLKSLSLVVNALAAVGDVLIAGALCTLLHRSRSGFQRSDTMINKLILMAINTGLLTSLFAVASLVSYLASPHTFLYMAFYFCIGRLYTNALLATLNARKRIRATADALTDTDGKFNFSLRELPNSNGANSRRDTAAGISIRINTTKEFATE